MIYQCMRMAHQFELQDKGFMDFAEKQITRELTEKVMAEIEKGDMVVSLSSVTYEDEQWDMVGIRQKIDITPLVRCKNCIYCTFFPNGFCGFCHSFSKAVLKDDYCSFGKRRGNDTGNEEVDNLPT